MIRLLTLCALTAALVCAPARADDPPKKLTADERTELERKLTELNTAGLKAYQAGKYPDAVASFEAGLQVAKQLYNATDFPDGHPSLARSLSNLGTLYRARGRLADAEPLLKDAVEMHKRLFKGDHPALADSLSNLAGLYQSRGKLADAEPLFHDALGMRKRLFKGDHPDVALGMNNLAGLYLTQAKLADAERLFKDALDMRKRLSKGDHPNVARDLGNLGFLYQEQGKLTDAEPLLNESAAMFGRLFKGDHPDVATSLNNLAHLYQAQGRLADAESLLKDALAMFRRLFKGAHPSIALGLNNLAFLYQARGKLADAEQLFKDALDVRRRLFKGDHPDLAQGLINLASLLMEQGKLADAEPLFKEGLDMRKRLFKGDHPLVALGMNNLAALYLRQARSTDAERLCKDALDMRRRLFKGDHPDLALGLSNLAGVYWARGKPADAEPLFKESLAMLRRLFKGDHPEIARNLNNFGALYHAQGRLADAESILKDALGMYRRLAIAFVRHKTEGDVLTLLARLPLTHDGFLSVARERASDPADVYAQVWADKGYVARAFERRQLQARAATDPGAAKALAELTDARRRRAELLLAPNTSDPATRAAREADIEIYEKRIGEKTAALAKLLPASARADQLASATVADLQKALPADAAVMDFVYYTHFGPDESKNGKAGGRQAERYLAFVVTTQKVAWADLGPAADVEAAVAAWRDAITGGKEIPAAVPAKVRELVWAKARKELPADVTTVYLCPDAGLHKVPFAALPGDKPGTVLLEDFALATIPHAPFLLDKLWPQDPLKSPPADALVVGAVRYDADATGGTAVRTASAPLLKPDEKRAWAFLPNTAGEANGIAAAAARKKLAAVRIEGDKATSAAVLAALPKAKYAHFATHGFFSDPSFRGLFQLDEKDYATTAWGERVGRAVNSPLLMTGLVFAGANDPKAPGRGIVTGEQLVDLDLSGLELAVLSACETGLGDVAGGQGTFGLQRAFHYAGATNVVCSLWKVPDAPTAALMGLFYRNLWDNGLSPMEALRRAQLEVYRNPGKVAEWAKGFRGTFEEVEGPKVEAKAPADGTAHPLLWAAFTLSGPGR